MNRQHDEGGKFAKNYSPKDMDKFVKWIKDEKDYKWMEGTMIRDYKVNTRTAYRWIHEAAKKAN